MKWQKQKNVERVLKTIFYSEGDIAIDTFTDDKQNQRDTEETIKCIERRH